MTSKKELKESRENYFRTLITLKGKDRALEILVKQKQKEIINEVNYRMNEIKEFIKFIQKTKQ